VNHDAVVRSLPVGDAPFVMLKERGDDVMVDQIRVDPQTGRAQTDRLIVRAGRSRRVRFSLRLPTVPELTLCLHEAGFNTVRAFDERAGRSPSTPRGCPSSPARPTEAWERSVGYVE
jgi:hypothetical protein